MPKSVNTAGATATRRETGPDLRHLATAHGTVFGINARVVAGGRLELGQSVHVA